MPLTELELGAELFHADGQMDGYDEASSRFSQFFLRRATEKDIMYILLLSPFYGPNKH
jgi:hypothetical protein